MTISSASEGWSLEIETACKRLLHREVSDVERIGGGRNSRVYRLTCASLDASTQQATYVLKHYVRHPGDDRDRLATEFGAFRFLWDHDARRVPEPIATDPALNLGIYEHIAGTPMVPDDVDEHAVDQSVAFLAELAKLSELPESRRLAVASEACFSTEELLNSLRRRLDRLRPCKDERLQAFLADALEPALGEIWAWCHERIAKDGGTASDVLAESERTLSPSDFGFHNAIRRPTGELAFVDFEYFGWDDPAKTLSDWLLHPGMTVAEDLKRRFASRTLEAFAGRGQLEARGRILYPLFGLKWCLILLNEFVPDDEARRSFAKASGEYVGRRLQPSRESQLEKSKTMLAKVQDGYRDNPYL